MNDALQVVVDTSSTPPDAIGDTFLSVLAQTTPPERVIVLVEKHAGHRTREILDRIEEFGSALPYVDVIEFTPPLDARTLSGPLHDLAGHVSTVRAGDVLFDHWAETIRDVLAREASPSRTIVRMRFVRQLTSLTPAGAPFADSVPVRPYADHYADANHVSHCQTPSSAVAWPAEFVTLAGAGAQDPFWRILREGAKRGCVVDTDAITSLVRAWDAEEWSRFEANALERPPRSPAPRPLQPRRLSGVRAALRRLIRR